MTRGTVRREQRIIVNVEWSAVPAGASQGSITVNGPDGQKVQVIVPVFNPTSPQPEELAGFIETDACVSIEAEHFTRAIESPTLHWKIIPDFGRTLSGVTTFPVTAQSQALTSNSPHLEYQMHIFHEGATSVDVYLAPTQKFLPGDGLRYAISFDDETPQVVNVHSNYTQAEWERSVKDGVRVLTTKHVLTRAGSHVLKLWAIDPALVFEKLVVNTGATRQSYLGPPESFRRVRR